MTSVRPLDPGEAAFPTGDNEWRFIAEDSGQHLGAVSLAVSTTTTDPAWLGSLPTHELTAFGLELPWDGDFIGVGKALFQGAAAQLAGKIPDQIQARVNPDYHDHVSERRALLRELGLVVFQEKQGFRWADDGVPIDVPGRLVFESVMEVGENRFASVMAGCGEGTIDRNDRYYWTGSGPANWGAQMMTYLDPDDGPMWLLGLAGDDPVGFIAVASNEAWGSTIIHVGVLPARRGLGYVNDLLLAGTAAAQSAGIPAMLSDVDVLNEPMKAAMRANGHHDHDLWHVWEYRGPFGPA